MAELTDEQRNAGRLTPDHPEITYVTVFHCDGCGEDVKFVEAAWNVWTDEQREAFIAEAQRQHLGHGS